MRRDQVDVKRSRIWVARLKNSLSVEHPIAGDELRAIKRYLATRTDKLPWLFISEREAQLTRQAVNYLIRAAGEEAKLGRVGPTCSVTPAVTTWPTRAWICAPFRTTSVTVTPSTRRTIAASRGAASRGCGDRHPSRPWSRCTTPRAAGPRSRQLIPQFLPGREPVNVCKSGYRLRPRAVIIAPPS